MTKNKSAIWDRRLPVILALGFASGLPLALSGSTLQAWFATTAVSTQEIGMLTLVSLPYVFKFLWAPLLDGWVPPFLGRRRGWILISQVCLILAIGAMSLLEPAQEPRLMALVALLIAFFSASQDIAIDAYRTDVLPKSLHALGAAMGVNGYRIAMLVSGGIALLIVEHLGFQMTYLCLALTLILGIFATLLGPNPEHDVVRSQSWQNCVIKPLGDFMHRKHAVWLLCFIVCYKLGDAFVGSLTTTFLIREVHLSLVEIGTLVKVTGFVATILGGTVGALLLLRWGWFRSLFLFGVLQALSNLLYIGLMFSGSHYLWAGSAIFLENLLGAMATSAFVGLIMNLCNPQYTAFQFALLSALSAVGRVVVGPIAGSIAHHQGWFAFFIASLVLSIPGLILLWGLRPTIEEACAPAVLAAQQAQEEPAN